MVLEKTLESPLDCKEIRSFPGGSVVKNLPANARFISSISGSGRSPGGGNGNQSILKEISPGISLEGMMLKLKLQYFGHLM